jgi:hypothetical protein
MQVDPKALEALFEDHYWDSLAGHKPVVMEHVRAVLALADPRPEAGTAGGVEEEARDLLDALSTKFEPLVWTSDMALAWNRHLAPAMDKLRSTLAASPAATRGEAFPVLNFRDEPAARAAFEKHYGRGFDLSRTGEWGDGYVHDGIEAMWKGWRECWLTGHAVPESTPAPESARGEAVTTLVGACKTMADDYQTSEQHHPHHVLVPLAAFTAMRSALAHPASAPAPAEGDTEAARRYIQDWVPDCVRTYVSMLEAQAARTEPAAEMVLRKAIKAVTDATSAYLPPDGISKDECINRVLAATDNPEINAVMLGDSNGRS